MFFVEETYILEFKQYFHIESTLPTVGLQDIEIFCYDPVGLLNLMLQWYEG
jgi:hypothetical protein